MFSEPYWQLVKSQQNPFPLKSYGIDGLSYMPNVVLLHNLHVVNKKNDGNSVHLLFYIYYLGTNLNFASSYKIPPQNSSVDIVVEITDDLLAEKDQMVLFNMIASYPGVTIPNTDLRRTVAVTILDNEGNATTIIPNLTVELLIIRLTNDVYIIE